MSEVRHPRWLWLSLGIVAADRVSKLAIENCTSEDFHHVLLPGFATLVHSNNPGIAFGLFADSQSKWLLVLLVVGTSAVIGLLAWLLTHGRAGAARSQAGLALILGGAAGNLVDRVLFGRVTDFFELHVSSFHWPAFNLADSAITIGALLVLLELLRGHPHLSAPTTEKKV
jgi:signal peptidase II